MKIKRIGMTREELHAGARATTQEMRDSEAAWLLTRPQVVQDLAAKVNTWKIQRIKEGAPYRVTGPGTIGVVMGYSERVAPLPPLLIFVAHEIHYDEQAHTPEELKKLEMLDGPLKVNVASEWLEVDELEN